MAEKCGQPYCGPSSSSIKSPIKGPGIGPGPGGLPAALLLKLLKAWAAAGDERLRAQAKPSALKTARGEVSVRKLADTTKELESKLRLARIYRVTEEQFGSNQTVSTATAREESLRTALDAAYKVREAISAGDTALATTTIGMIEEGLRAYLG